MKASNNNRLFENGKKAITLRKICEIMGCQVPENFISCQDEINNNITTSRKRITKGCIFMLLFDFKKDLEEQLDGIIEDGASIVFTDKEAFLEVGLKPEDYPQCILIDNKIEQIGDVYSEIREHYDNMKTIAITGTVGKTTTNRMLGALIRDSFTTFSSGGNKNSYAATSLHIDTKLNDELEVYVQEVGAASPNSVRKSAAMLKPDGFILLNVKDHHMNTYKTYENLFADKTSADDYMPEDGFIVTNYDDEGIANHQFKHRVVSFGVETTREVDYKAANVRQNRENLEFDVIHQGITNHIVLPILGTHNVYNAMAAYAMASELGIEKELLAQRFADYKSVGIRQNLINVGGRYLFIDCYNACEASILSSFDAMEEFDIAEGNKKIGIIGGENKLGERAAEVHYRIGQEIADRTIDKLVFFGKLRRTQPAIDRYGDVFSMLKGFEENGGKNARVLTTLKYLSKFLVDETKPGDLVFFKAVLWLDIAAAIDIAFGTALCFDYSYYRAMAKDVDNGEYVAKALDLINGAEIFKVEKKKKDVVIPNSIKGCTIFRIGKKVYTEDDVIETFDSGKALRNIGRNSLSDCPNLKYAVIRGNVKTIENGAFSNCESLEKVELEYDVTDIGNNAFINDKSLAKVLIPPTVLHIGTDTFSGCEELTIICKKDSYAETFAKENGINVSYSLHWLGKKSRHRINEILLRVKRKIGRMIRKNDTKPTAKPIITDKNNGELFNSNMKLGFGFNRLPFTDKTRKVPDYEMINGIVDVYIANGGRYFETGYNYMNYESETIVKKCLIERYPRESIILCDKMPVRFSVVYKKGFEEIFKEQLEKCGVDYFDAYLLHNVGGRAVKKVNETGAFDFLKKIKSEGKAKHIGFSFHDKASILDELLTAHPEVDFVQLQINYQDWESPAIESRKCYEVAKKHGKLVSVMEPLKGGNLVKRLPEEAKEIIENAGYTPASLGLRYAASLDNVGIVLSGMASRKQVRENAKILKEPYNLGKKGYEVIDKVLASINSMSQYDCTNCGYCLDVCPKNIPINGILQLVNNEIKDGKMINRNARLFYGACVSQKGKASECINCGKCEDICSQRLPIREGIAVAKKIFEKLDD